ncbi:MAG: group II intron reverse transcriptase/maturase, partial [Deltaproteobacteria bacterium]|nr:group II intron reverse transcriptase/maturase [Deltaproteobacteria bacterium]
MDHAHLRRLIGHRVRDGVLRRLIGKWLKAGVLEQGAVTYPDAGSPQGGVISPVLSNIFLHYVLDEWMEQVVKPRLRGKAFLVRYADDFVMGFTHEKDARRVLAVLAQRLGKYGLAIHADKTRLIAFQEPAKAACEKDMGSGPQAGTFTLLGFTHYWGRSPQGRWVVKRKTASSRLSRALQSLALWCRANRHRPVKEQQQMLSLKLRGHFAYYGITGNFRSLTWFRFEVVRCWRKWLNRRNRERSLDWNIFNRLLERY